MQSYEMQDFTLNQSTIDSSFKKCRRFFVDLNKISKFELINKKRGQLYKLRMDEDQNQESQSSPTGSSKIQTELINDVPKDPEQIMTEKFSKMEIAKTKKTLKEGSNPKFDPGHLLQKPRILLDISKNLCNNPSNFTFHIWPKDTTRCLVSTSNKSTTLSLVTGELYKVKSSLPGGGPTGDGGFYSDSPSLFEGLVSSEIDKLYITDSLVLNGKYIGGYLWEHRYHLLKSCFDQMDTNDPDENLEIVKNLGQPHKFAKIEIELVTLFDLDYKSLYSMKQNSLFELKDIYGFVLTHRDSPYLQGNSSPYQYLVLNSGCETNSGEKDKILNELGVGAQDLVNGDEPVKCFRMKFDMDLRCLCTCSNELRINLIDYADKNDMNFVENETSCRLNKFKLMKNKVYHVNFKKYRFDKVGPTCEDSMDLEKKFESKFGELVVEEFELVNYSKTQRAHSLDVICGKLNETSAMIDYNKLLESLETFGFEMTNSF